MTDFAESLLLSLLWSLNDEKSRLLDFVSLNDELFIYAIAVGNI